MEWKKVKWLIIALLLAVNIFLGINIAVRYTTAVTHEKADLLSALTLVDDGLDFTFGQFNDLPRYLYSFFGTRNLEAEESLCEKLMGQGFDSQEMGGGVYLYSLPSMERLIFRRGCALEGIVPAPKEDAATLLADFFDGYKLTFSQNGETFSFSYENTPISNASVSYLVSGDYLSLSGRLPLAEKWEKQEKSRSRSEMVLALAQAMTDNEMGSLVKIQAVYFIESEGISDLNLTPAWHAQCTGGNITVSMMDKSVLSVEK